MKTAVVGSRSLNVKFLWHYVPTCATEIVSGGAKGIDTLAKSYAEEIGCKYTEFLPDYEKYGKAAPIRRNDEIVDYADIVIAMWDGESKGTKYVIDICKKTRKSLIVYKMSFSKTLKLSTPDSIEYYNINALDDKMLKRLIISELDKETSLEVNLDLIKLCIKAILENKTDIKDLPKMKAITDRFGDDIDAMIQEILNEFGPVDLDNSPLNRKLTHVPTTKEPS